MKIVIPCTLALGTLTVLGFIKRAALGMLFHQVMTVLTV